jgi:hypothetical protein
MARITEVILEDLVVLSGNGDRIPVQQPHIMKANKNNFSVRLEPELRRQVEEVAKLGGVNPADVIRVCIVGGIPIVKKGYALIHSGFAAKLEHISRPIL